MKSGNLNFLESSGLVTGLLYLYLYHSNKDTAYSSHFTVSDGVDEVPTYNIYGFLVMRVI